MQYSGKWTLCWPIWTSGRWRAPLSSGSLPTGLQKKLTRTLSELREGTEASLSIYAVPSNTTLATFASAMKYSSLEDCQKHRLQRLSVRPVPGHEDGLEKHWLLRQPASPERLGTAIVRSLLTIEITAELTQTVTTEHAPGHPFKRGGWWYKLNFVAYPGLFVPPFSKIGVVIDAVIKPSGGWICGFTPVWGPTTGRCRRRVQHYKFAVIWPKFL